MAKDANFKPDYRDMQPSDYVHRRTTEEQKEAKALRSKLYRAGNLSKIRGYEEKNPVLRLRVSPEVMSFLRAQAETPQKLVRRLIHDYIATKGTPVP